MVGDDCRPRRHCLYINDGPRVHGGRTIKEEPRARGNRDKDAQPKIKINTLYPDSVFINVVLSIYNLDVRIRGFFD